MNEQEKVVTKQNGKTNELCKIKLSNDPDNGFQIYVQSNHNFAFLASQGKQETWKFGGIDCLHPRQGSGSQLPGVPGYFDCGKDRFFVEGNMNLSLLLAKNIKDGVTFSFGLLPIGEDKLNEYIQLMKTQVKLIYLTYMRRISVSAPFTTSIIETENFD